MSDRTCNTCGRVFNFPSQLVRHTEGKKQCKLKLKNEITTCSYCNVQFANGFSLRRHHNVCKKYLQAHPEINTSNATPTIDINNNVLPTNNLNINDMNSQFSNILANTNLQNNINFQSAQMILNNINNLYSRLFEIMCKEQNLANTTNTIQQQQPQIQQPQIQQPQIQQPQIQQPQNNQVINNVQNQNVIQNQNVQNNVVQNNVINNNNIILPNVINPFGYEDISHISDVEKLRILTSHNGLELGLKLLYNKVSNRNFFRPNANKDNIAVLDSDLKVQIKDKKSFNDDMLDKGIVIMYRLLDSCNSKLSFKDKLLIEQNITRNRDMLRFDYCIKSVMNIIETCLQDSVSKDIFKKFSDKLSREETFRKEKLKLVKQLIDELKKFNTELNNVSISDAYLRNEVWYIDESRNDDMDPHDLRNNLENNYIENTARYKILQKMKEEEYKYFEDHGITLGDLRQYRMIQLDRARQEIELMNEIYKDDMLKEELENKLLNNNNNFDSNLSRIKFIEEDDEESLQLEIDKLNIPEIPMLDI